MALARQTPGAVSAIGKLNSALLLHVYGAFWFGDLGLWRLVFLGFLLLRRFLFTPFVVCLSLLALLGRIRGGFGCAFLG